MERSFGEIASVKNVLPSERVELAAFHHDAVPYTAFQKTDLTVFKTASDGIGGRNVAVGGFAIHQTRRIAQRHIGAAVRIGIHQIHVHKRKIPP